jgi:hypothetical protein
MVELTVQVTAWRQGYEAALRDVEEQAARLLGQGTTPSLVDVLAQVRAALASAPAGRPTPAEAAGIPAEELEREWTAG